MHERPQKIQLAAAGIIEATAHIQVVENGVHPEEIVRGSCHQILTYLSYECRGKMFLFHVKKSHEVLNDKYVCRQNCAEVRCSKHPRMLGTCYHDMGNYSES